MEANTPCVASVLRVAVLGSGSSGNATAVGLGPETILVDAGFSARETLRRLEASGADSRSVTAIVVTHEHSDHIRGVRVLASRLGVPVYASPGTIRAADLESWVDDVRPLPPGSTERAGSLRITAFRTSHDAAEPIGLRIDHDSRLSFGLISDTGVLTDEAAEVLHDSSIIALEFNHDVEMLQRGPYPWFLKNRILSTRGHLSNDDAASAIERLAHDGLSHVIAMHLSRTNNTVSHAEEALRGALVRLDHAGTTRCASQDAPCLIELRLEENGAQGV